MNLTALAIEKRTVSYFTVFLLAVGGAAAFFQLGQLEDPDFTVKTAAVITDYPGASPRAVELEVTDRIEKAIQELPQLDTLYSISRAGRSIIQVDIKQDYWADRLPQVWDELRKKIRDASGELPPGVGAPNVLDDFSFVYGFVLSVTGDGFSPRELDVHVEAIRKELALVEGVSRAEVWGKPVQVVYLETTQKQLAELGVTPMSIGATLGQQNMVVDAGSVDLEDMRFRIAPSGEFASPEEIGQLVIQSSAKEPIEKVGRAMDTGDDYRRTRDGELITIADLGNVRRGVLEPPPWEMRFDGATAQAISLAAQPGANVVEIGRALDARVAELVGDLPIGIELQKVAWQSDLVSEAVNGFMVNLIQAIAIVLAVLAIPMGWRMGVIIGTALILTILGTFMVMSILGIDLQRMSLGALVIALGMMVDNAIVVADGIYARLKRGMDRRQAAIESTSGPAIPLLGATFVAVMAFYPIYASTADAGEYCRSLFSVVAISLLLSWLIAMTITPLQCMDLLDGKSSDGEEDPYAGRLFQLFRTFLVGAMRRRVLFMGVMIGLLVASVAGFGGVRQMFFPDASRAQLMLDYWAPEGTRFQQVSEDLRPIEAHLLESPRVASVATFVGQGPPRFYLPVASEFPYESYAQVVVNTHDFEEIDALIAELEPWLEENLPQALVRARKYGVGPSDTWKFEARFSGPAEADPAVLRGLAAEGVAILANHPMATDVRTDMRQRVRKIVPEYNQERGRWTDITRNDLARSTRRAFDGLQIGLYREGDTLLPILLRQVEAERERAAGDLDFLQVQAQLQTETVPLASVTTDLRTEWEDPIIIRWNRRRAATVQGTPEGVTFPTLHADVVERFEAIELPPGYELFWDGEYDSTVSAQASLTPGVIPAVVVMLFIIVALFNAFRPPLIIVFTIPFAMIGITLGLLVTRAPFGFVALLGAMSLVGMMIKNAIVLLDEVDAELAAGTDPYHAVINAALSRLRPVVLAAATTVLGVIPLLGDVFWFSMAVTIMAGLAFGTVLTMVVVPVFYVILFRIEPSDPAEKSLSSPS